MATTNYTKGGVRRRKDTFTPMSRAAVPAVKPVVRTTTKPTSSANLPVGPTMLLPRAVLPEGKPQKTKAPFEPTLQGTPTPKRPKGATKKRTVKPTSSANLSVGPTMLVPRTNLPEGKPQKTKAPLEPTLQGTSAPKGPKGATKKRTHISALRLLIAQLPDNERERGLLLITWRQISFPSLLQPHETTPCAVSKWTSTPPIANYTPEGQTDGNSRFSGASR